MFSFRTWHNPRFSIILLLSILLPSLFGQQIFLTPAATLTVCASGCNYTAIQVAINAAAPGDTISILDPVHTEAGISVTKSLSIQGQGSTIVQAAASPPSWFAIMGGVRGGRRVQPGRGLTLGSR